MSETTTTPAPEKMKLSALLAKVSQIASGMDKSGVLPGEEGHAPSTAPDVTVRWCASVLRILLTRLIEHVVETRRAIFDLRTEIHGRPATDDKPEIVGLTRLRGDVAEMTKLLAEIVETIKKAQGDAPASAAPAPEAPADPETIPEPPTAEAAAERAHQAEIDAMAARVAEGTKRGEVVPITPPGNAKQGKA